MWGVLPDEFHLSPTNHADEAAELLDPSFTLAVGFAERLSHQQLATCHALALHVDGCVELCMKAGASLQKGSIAAAGSDPSGQGSEAPSLATLLAVEDPQTASAVRGILLALQALGTSLIGVAASLSTEVVVPLYRLHRNMKSEQTQLKAELAMVQQHEKFCFSALGESKEWNEKVAERFKHLSEKSESHAQKQRFRWLKRPMERKAEVEMKRAAASQKSAVEELQLRSDEVAIAQLNKESGVQAFKDVLQRVEVKRSDLFFKVLGKCAKAWKEASEALLWSSVSMAKQRQQMILGTRTAKPIAEAPANMSESPTSPLSPAIESTWRESQLESQRPETPVVAGSSRNLKVRGNAWRGSHCGATASSSRVCKVAGRESSKACERAPAVAVHDHDICVDALSDGNEDAGERCRGKGKLLRPLSLEMDLILTGEKPEGNLEIALGQHSDIDTSTGVKKSSSGIDVKHSTSGFSHVSSATPLSPSQRLSPSAAAAFKLLGVDDSDSETDVDAADMTPTTTDAADLTGPDADTPSPKKEIDISVPSWAKKEIGILSKAQNANNVETPSPLRQPREGASVDEDLACTVERVNSIEQLNSTLNSIDVKQNEMANQSHINNGKRSNLCCPCTR